MPDEPKSAQLAPSCEQRYYANGFALAIGASDVQATFNFCNSPICHLSMSYTTAKTLAVKLSAAISEFEKRIEYTMLTMDDINKKITPTPAKAK
jgi:hypothetical protein